MKENKILTLDEFISKEIKRFSKFPDKYTAGRIDALIRIQLHIKELKEYEKDLNNSI